MNGWGSEGLTSDEETCAFQNLVTVASFSRSVATKKCTGTKDLVDDIIRKSHPLIWSCAKKKFHEHSKIIFCALVIKTSEINVVNVHHLDVKQSLIYE